jgi:hypothetical protein
MSAPLAPPVALAWLASLSIDLQAAAVLDACGALLAGDEALGGRAAAALAAAPDASEVRDGDLLAVRSARHAVAVAVGPHALGRLVRLDLGAALEALDAS